MAEGVVQNGYQITEVILQRLKLTAPAEVYEIWRQAYEEGKQYVLHFSAGEMQVRFI